MGKKNKKQTNLIYNGGQDAVLIKEFCNVDSETYLYSHNIELRIRFGLV